MFTIGVIRWFWDRGEVAEKERVELKEREGGMDTEERDGTHRHGRTGKNSVREGRREIEREREREKEREKEREGERERMGERERQTDREREGGGEGVDRGEI